MLPHVKVQGSSPSFRVMEKQGTLGQSCLSSQKAIDPQSQYVLLHSAFAGCSQSLTAPWSQRITALQGSPGMCQPGAQPLPGGALSFTGLPE